MLVTVTMLAIALIPTGDSLWLSNVSLGEIPVVPVVCYFRRLTFSNPNNKFSFGLVSGTMIASLLVLFSGHMTRLIKLSQRATAATKHWLRTKPSRLLKSTRSVINRHGARSHRNVPHILVHVLMETLYVFLKAIVDVFDSMLWEVGILFKTYLTRTID